MATQPRPPNSPAPHPPPSPPPDGEAARSHLPAAADRESGEFRRRLYGMDEHGVATRDGEWDPNPDEVRLVSREQLERSAEIEKVGVAKWMAEHDTRPESERPKAPVAEHAEHR